MRALIAHRRQDDPNPDDPFRGLYLSDEAVDRLLQPAVPPPPLPGPDRDLAERAGDAAEQAGEPVRLRQLARAAGLTDLDIEFLIAALAPDLDSRFERLYGYLNNDVTRRRATVGLVLELAGVPCTSAGARARLAPGGPLLDHRLIVVDDASSPFLTRSLRVPDRVTSHLLGDDTCDPALADALSELSPYDCPIATRLAAVLGRDVRLVYVRDHGRRSAAAAAAAALRGSGRPVLGLDFGRVSAAEIDGLVQIAGREALLLGAGVVAGPVDGFAGQSATVLRRLGDLPVPVLLHGEATWDPGWSPTVPLQVDAPILGTADRNRIWHAELDGFCPACRCPCTSRLDLSRSPARSWPPGCQARSPRGRPTRRRCLAARASRTPRASNAWPAASNPPSAGQISSCPPRCPVSSASLPPGPGTATRC